MSNAPETARSITRNAYLARQVADMQAGEVRRDCGISALTIARALGVTSACVSMWESGRRRPSGPAGEAYVRIIAGLTRHRQVPEM